MKVSIASAVIGPAPGMVRRAPGDLSLAREAGNFLVQHPKSLGQPCDLFNQLTAGKAHQRGQVAAVRLYDPDQRLHILNADRCYVAKLIKMRPQRIDGLGALTNELRAGPEQDCPCLLFRRLGVDKTHGPIEIPWHWSMDDAPYALFATQSPRPIFTNEHILQVWKAEFDEVYRWGGLLNVVMHPQITGRPARIAMLRSFIAHVRTYDDVWFATGTEVAEAWTAMSQNQ